MKILEKIIPAREELNQLKGEKIGLVPTMGYLHEGHLSLIKESQKNNDITVVSIFVNPTQFAVNEDLDTYPQDFNRDSKLLKNIKVDYLFHPSVAEIYPQKHLTFVKVRELDRVLCGISRPTHFEGVTTIVLKLFNIIKPSSAYFGQKDAQQAIIIKKMVRDLNLDITIRVLPIIRDHDGLALSSRNKYLSPLERETALLFPKSLQQARELIDSGERDSSIIIKKITETLSLDNRITIDYLKILKLNNLQDQPEIDSANTLVAGAVKIGKTRLIDNFILGAI
jgi:pantoate--beta-alanine ligase